MNTIRVLYSYWRIFAGVLGFDVYLMLGCSIFIATLDVVGIVMIIPILGSFILGSGDVAVLISSYPKTLQQLFSLLSSFGAVVSLVFFVIVMAIKAGSIYIASMIQIKIKAKFFSLIKYKGATEFMLSDVLEKAKVPGGVAANILNEQGTIATKSMQNFLIVLSSIFSLSVYISSLFYTDFITGLILFTYAFAGYLAFHLLVLKSKRLSAQRSQVSSRLNGFLTEILQSRGYLIASGRQSLVLEKVFEKVELFTSVEIALGKISAALAAFREFYILILLILAVLTSYLITEDLKLASVSSLIIAFRAMSGITNFQNRFNSFSSQAGAVDAVFDKINYHKIASNHNPNHAAVMAKEPGARGACHEQMSGDEIRFENVVLPFLGSAQLEHNVKEINSINGPGISFKVKRNTLVAITGPSGAGKSSILLCLLGLLRPVSGNIFYGEHAVSDDLASRLTFNVGYVPQEPFVLDGSIKENIVWDDSAEDCDDLWSVLEAVALAPLVRASSGQLDFMVGPSGGKLSGGERQRLALARELYRKPALFVLDEPTSALDKSTEERVISALLEAKQNATIIVVSHSSSLLDAADLIVDLGSLTIYNKSLDISTNMNGL